MSTAARNLPRIVFMQFLLFRIVLEMLPERVFIPSIFRVCEKSP